MHSPNPTTRQNPIPTPNQKSQNPRASKPAQSCLNLPIPAQTRHNLPHPQIWKNEPKCQPVSRALHAANRSHRAPGPAQTRHNLPHYPTPENRTHLPFRQPHRLCSFALPLLCVRFHLHSCQVPPAARQTVPNPTKQCQPAPLENQTHLPPCRTPQHHRHPSVNHCTPSLRPRAN